MKRILLIDNYDSFTYNVLHLLERACGVPVDIVKNDSIPFFKIGTYSHIVFSPGPGTPSEWSVLREVIDLCKESHAILGICLGHQAIAEYFGAKLINLERPLHGHISSLTIDIEDPVLGLLSKRNQAYNHFNVGLYHSWAVDISSLNNNLKTGAVNELGIVMTLYHKVFSIYGVQFHPESVNTERGEEIIRSWWESTATTSRINQAW